MILTFFKNIDNAYDDFLKLIRKNPSNVLLKDLPRINIILNQNFSSNSEIENHLKNYLAVILREKPNQDIGSSTFWLYRGAIRVLVKRSALIPDNFDSGNFTFYIEKLLEYLNYPDIDEKLAISSCINSIEFCRAIDSQHNKDFFWKIMDRCYNNVTKKISAYKSINASEFYRMFSNELLLSIHQDG